MALSLSSAAIAEKNKLSSSGSWICLLHVVFPDDTTLRLARNTEDVVWPSSGGHTYTAWPFEIGNFSETAGEVPSVEIKISNATRALLPYVDQANGAKGATVRMMIVHSGHLDLTSPEVDINLTCRSTKWNNTWITFVLSAAGRARRMFPGGRMMKTFCRYREFGGDRCGVDLNHPSYDGGGCDRSLARCREIWADVGPPTVRPRLVGAVFTDNSPSTGLVSWNAHTVNYNGSNYSIPAGNTVQASTDSASILITWSTSAMSEYSVFIEEYKTGRLRWDSYVSPYHWWVAVGGYGTIFSDEMIGMNLMMYNPSMQTYYTKEIKDVDDVNMKVAIDPGVIGVGPFVYTIKPQTSWVSDDDNWIVAINVDGEAIVIYEAPDQAPRFGGTPGIEGTGIFD